MRKAWVAAGVGAAVFLAFAPQSAHARSLHRCSNGASTYYSDKPCGVHSGKMGAIGPAPERRHKAYKPPSRPMERAPEFLPYLSGQCASLHDAIRTGPTRGLEQQTLRNLRDEYRDKCAEDEREARGRMRKEAREQRDERKKQEQAASLERSRNVAEQDRCGEMKRIVRSRRARFDAMTDGEKADFLRFEDNYTDRCLGG